MLSLFPIALNLAHRTFVKRFVSLQFLNPKKTVGRTPRMWNQAHRKAATYTNRK
jgi:hypothetical protein